MNYKWSIIEISAKDGVITHARYKVVASDEGVAAETEGNWWFREPNKSVPFEQISEQMVAEWIKKETTDNNVNQIESRLKEQVDLLKTHKPVVAPWLPQVFTPEL